MFKVAFLFDKSNSWIKKYFKNFSYKKKKFMFKFFFDSKKIKNFDIVFILGYTKILKTKFLNYNKLNLLIHESDLPYGKGFSPIQWQILKGKKKIIFSILEAVKKFDSGAIFEKKKIVFKGYELNNDIRKIQGETTLYLVKNFLKDYPKNILKKIPQKGKSTYFKRRNLNDSQLDINKSIKSQFNLLRIVDNEKYPAFFKYKSKKYKLKIFNF